METYYTMSYGLTQSPEIANKIGMDCRNEFTDLTMLTHYKLRQSPCTFLLTSQSISVTGTKQLPHEKKANFE